MLCFVFFSLILLEVRTQIQRLRAVTLRSAAAVFSTMESGVVHIFKEDRCPSGQSGECVPNFTWQPGLSDIFNYTNGTWDAELEPMSPIIPIIVAVYSVVFVVGLVGNCLVMYVIIR